MFNICTSFITFVKPNGFIIFMQCLCLNSNVSKLRSFLNKNIFYKYYKLLCSEYCCSIDNLKRKTLEINIKETFFLSLNFH